MTWAASPLQRDSEARASREARLGGAAELIAEEGLDRGRAALVVDVENVHEEPQVQPLRERMRPFHAQVELAARGETPRAAGLSEVLERSLRERVAPLHVVAEDAVAVVG